MPLADDARTLATLARGLTRGADHADALERFYRPQASQYDAFRERLLHGRRELVERLPCPEGGVVIELGAGTGRNLAFFGDRLKEAARVEVVDLCRPLLDVAAARWSTATNVHVVLADACRYRPPALADCVYLSYALTMIPDWRAAIENALSMLRPGGTLGVVDFYVSQQRPLPGLASHDWLTRHVWPAWFRHAGVRLSPHHLPELRQRVSVAHLEERRAPVPYLPLVRVPYFVLVGTAG